MYTKTLSTLAVLVVALAGCGGDKDSGTKKQTKPATGKTNDEKNTTKKQTSTDQPTSATTGPGSWKRIAKDDAFKKVIGAVVHGGALYHAVTDGTLYKTDLATGKPEQISRKPDFGGIRWLFDAGDTMLSIDRNGTVYKITADAQRTMVGKPKAYKDTIAAAVGDGNLYTIERDGTFYITKLSTMKWTSMKKAEYGDTRFMLATDGHVVTVEKDGSAFEIQPSKNNWWNLGPNDLWKGTRTATFHAGKLYRIARGVLYNVELTKKGTSTPLGKPDFQHVVWMGSDGTSLITLEKDGSLYRVAAR